MGQIPAPLRNENVNFRLTLLLSCFILDNYYGIVLHFLASNTVKILQIKKHF